MKHELKLLTEYFNPVLLGFKNFEVRLNDRGYKVGDELIMREWDGAEYTGRRLKVVVSYVLEDDRFLKPGYVILGIKDIASLDEAERVKMITNLETWLNEEIEE